MTAGGDPAVKGLQAHVYFDRATPETAAGVHDEPAGRFSVDCWWRDVPIGPHARPNFRARFSPEGDKLALNVEFLRRRVP